MSNHNPIKTYSELIKMHAFEDRLNYLKLHGVVGEDTFGFDRCFNQKFYNSNEWKQIRDFVIVRDGGKDLGCEDREIFDRIFVHHMNPISINDINNSTEFLLNPEYLICVSDNTHRAIHYDTEITDFIITERKPNDTIPWRK